MRVAVIGAGIVGASAAWHLARAGAEPVLIDAWLDGRATAAAPGSSPPGRVAAHLIPIGIAAAPPPGATMRP